MLEAGVLLNAAQALFTFLVLVIGWLIRESQAAQKRMNEKMAAKLDEILAQVNETNGRVGKLEVRADNNERNIVRVDAALGVWAQGLTGRLNKWIDRHHGGSE